MSVVVHAGGAPRYVRTIAGVGGDSVTRAVQQRYDWTWEDAERTKVFAGLPGHARMDDAQRESVTRRTEGLDHPAQPVIVAAVESLIGEIITTLEYYRTSVTDGIGAAEAPAEVARLLLTGSGSRLGGLGELLEERLGVPVERLDVRRQVRATRRTGLDEDDPSLVVPAGLCVGVGR